MSATDPSPSVEPAKEGPSPEAAGRPPPAPVESAEDVPPRWRGTPVERLLAYHDLGAPLDRYERAELLVGMCMDHRNVLRIPDNFAYVLRAGGANLRRHAFKVSFAIAVGGVRAIALIGHTDCGMVGLGRRREQFVEGLVTGAGWKREAAELHFDRYAPSFEIDDAADFVRREAARLRALYPHIPVCPLLYRVEDHRLYLLPETDPGGRGG